MEINKYDYNNKDLVPLSQEKSKLNKKVLKLRVIGSDYLNSTNGLSSFFSLEEVNFSGNKITAFVDFESLKGLKIINLASNEIRNFPDFSKLPCLKKINLSGNKISSMSNLHLMSRDFLQSLNLADNRLDELDELSLLERFKNLKEVVFHKNKNQTNFFCEDTDSYYRKISDLSNVGGLLIDNMNIGQIKVLIGDGKNRKSEDSPFYSFKANNTKTSKRNNYDQNTTEEKKMNRTSGNRKSLMESVNIVDVEASLKDNQFKKDSFVFENKERLYKEREGLLRNSNKYLQKQLEEYEGVINQLSGQLKSKESRYDKLEQKKRDYENSLRQKDSTIKEITNKLENEVKRRIQLEYELKNINNRLNDKEYEIKKTNDENRRFEIDNKKMENEVFFYKERYSQLESREKLQKEDSGKEKSFELSKKMNEENIRLKNEIMSLKGQIEISNDKENLKIEKIRLECDRDFSDLKKELEMNFKEKEENYIKIQKDLEKTYKENIDGMEKDFKEIIVELSDKNNALVTEINSSRNEKKGFHVNYKLLLEKNTEQKNEITKLLKKIEEIDQRRTSGDAFFKESLKGTELKLEETQKNLDKKIKETNDNKILIESLRKDKKESEDYILAMKNSIGKLERSVFDYKFKLESQTDMTDMLENKITKIKANFEKDKFTFESQIEELESNIKAKTIMLEDRNKESSRLKEKLKTMENLLSEIKNGQNNEVSRSKYDKLEEEKNRLREKNKKNRELFDEYEKELEEKTDLVERLKESIKEIEDELSVKESRIAELLEMIEEFKKSIVEKGNQMKSLKNKIQETEGEFKIKLDSKEKLVAKYKAEKIEAQEDARILILELDRTKKQVKLNVDKLQNILS